MYEQGTNYILIGEHDYDGNGICYCLMTTAFATEKIYHQDDHSVIKLDFGQLPVNV